MGIPVVLNSFNRGIISREVLGRFSSDWYFSALQECKNGTITPYGNVRKRQGTKYIANVVGSKFRMIPFIYSSTEAYVLLFVIDHNNTAGDNRIYFLTLDGFVTDDNGNPYYINLTYPSDVDLERIQYVQKDDVMYLACKGQPLKKLVRLAENNWTLSDVSVDLMSILAYGNGTSSAVEGNLPPDLIEPTKIELHYKCGGTWYSATDDGNGNFSGTNLVTATINYDTGKIYIKTAKSVPQNLYVWESGHSYSVGDYVLASNGCIFKCTTGGTSGNTEPNWTSTIDSTVTDNTVTWSCVLVPFDAGEPIYVKFLNHEDFTPGAVTIHQNRLVVGNFPKAPQVFMGSVVGNYEKFVLGTEPNNSYLFAIASRENNEITWLESSYKLIIGTLGGEYIASGISPTNVAVYRESGYGSNFIQPVNLGDTVIFVQTYGSRIYDFVYDYMVNGYTGIDLTLLNRDICKAGIKELSVIKQPFTQLLLLLNDGTLAVLTYLRSEKIIAWQKWETQGKVKTMATIPAITDNYSKTYIVVERNGLHYIEAFDNPEYEGYFDTVFVDSAVIYDGKATDTIPVPYPDGTTVSVLTATGVHKDVAVENGQIKLDWKTTRAVIGFGYDFILETVPIEIGVDGSLSTLGKPKTFSNFYLYLYNSIGGEIGYKDEWKLLFRTANDLMDNLVPLFSGAKKIDIFDSMTTSDVVSVKIRNSQPVPFNLLGIVFDLEVGNV